MRDASGLYRTNRKKVKWMNRKKGKPWINRKNMGGCGVGWVEVRLNEV